MVEAEGWIAIIGAVGGLGGVAAGIIATWQKQQAKRKNEELDYLFKQYKLTVDRVRKEHEEDRVILSSLQTEHIHCREELAGFRERQISQEAEISFLRQRVVAVSGQPPSSPGSNRGSNP